MGQDMPAIALTYPQVKHYEVNSRARILNCGRVTMPRDKRDYGVEGSSDPSRNYLIVKTYVVHTYAASRSVLPIPYIILYTIISFGKLPVKSKT